MMPVLAKRSLLYVKLLIPLFVLFIVVYGTINRFSTFRSDYYHFYFSWEQEIPFVPWMITIYASIQLLFLLPLFHCNHVAMRVLAKRIALAIVVAGVVFLVFPAEPGYVRQVAVGTFQAWFDVLYMLDEKHNMLPSLHITLATLVVIAVVKNTNDRLKYLYFFWLGLLYISVVLIHQHHIADIVSGLVLVCFCMRIIPSDPGYLYQAE